MLQISETQEGSALVLLLEGRLDSSTSAELERACDAHIAAGTTRVLFDMAGTQYVSSAGLRVFLVVAKRLQKAGGRLVLCSLQPMVREVLAIAGFDRILATAENRGEGLAKLV